MGLSTRLLISVGATASVLTGCAASGTDTITEEWVFGAPTRTVIAETPTQPSVGDMTVTTGGVLGDSDEVVGSYSTNQVTLLVNTDAGTETRRVDVSMQVPAGVLYATGVIEAVTDQPPTEAQTFAITGGTGAYDGASGTFIHEGIEGRPDFGVTLELLGRG